MPEIVTLSDLPMQKDSIRSSEPYALALRGVTCRFPDHSRKNQSYIAVQNATLEIKRGEFIAVVGPTGCGKSTLLNVAAGLLQQTEGKVEIFGKPLSGLNRDAGYMFQADSLFPWLTARRNVALGLELRGMKADQAAETADVWLQRVSLGAHGDRYPHQLSGGMKKRIALAQMLAIQPKILLMDEPFSALDIQTRQMMENELLGIWGVEQSSVLFVTHDLEEAIALADRVVVLSAGPGTSPVAEFTVDISRPRDVATIVQSPRYRELHSQIWDILRSEVMKAYDRNKNS